MSDALVWELMLQAGRIVNVHLPKDRVTQTHQGYGFVEFISEEDAEYAARIMNQVRLYGKPIRVNKVGHLYLDITMVEADRLFNRHRRTSKRRSRSVPNCLSEISIPWLTRRRCTTHLAGSGAW